MPEPHPRHLHRTGDPSTSGQAADEVVKTVGKRMREALRLVVKNPKATAGELDNLNRTPTGTVRKRLNDLAQIGFVEAGRSRTCRVSGRQAQTWTVTPRGLIWHRTNQPDPIGDAVARTS